MVNQICIAGLLQVLVVGGIISITMTYSTLTKQIELNKQEIEIAKELPPVDLMILWSKRFYFLNNKLNQNLIG